MKIDPITFEVLKNEIISIIEEMGALLKRSSFSPNVRERDDSSCSIFDAKGESIVEAKQVPLQIGILPLSMAEALKKFGDDLREGDMVIMNDPYMGGSHLPDIIVITPIFYRRKRIGFVGNLAHHNDLGGMSPRSICGDATELVQEGLRFPCVKLCEVGKIKTEVIELLMANTRTPKIEQGDIYAQINANLLGIRRIQEVCDKQGVNTVLTFMKEIKDYSERRMKKEIRAMPKGSFIGVDYLDIKDPPYKIQVRITITDLNLEFDFSETDLQTKSAMNIPLANLISAVQCVVRSITDPNIPHNSGSFRPIRIKAPRGTIINPNFPAAVSGAGEVACKTVEAMFHALHEALPEKVAAGTSGTGGNFGLGGIHPETGENYIYGEPSGGGYGAGSNQDGESGFQPPISNVSDTPAETIESIFPLFVECYGFIPDSGGAGKFRGGLGLRRDIRVLNHEAMLSLQGARTIVPPYGLEGGRPGRVAKFVMNPGTPEETPVKPLGTTFLEAGSVISFQTPGGGGYGDPIERDPEKVRQDVIDGYVTLDGAQKEYGIVIDPISFQINLEETKELRARVKK